MNDNIKITVIVLGNCEKERLDQCISSLVGQTHYLYEAFVVLNEDDTITIADIEHYGDARIMGISCKADATPLERLNEGFCRMCTESLYCVCIDGNDRVSLDYLDAMLKEIVGQDCDVVCGGTVLLQPDGDKIGNVLIGVWNKIYKRHIIDWDNARLKKTLDSTYYRTINDIEFEETPRGFDGRYEILKGALFDPKYEYISFDIFDTLIQRPFYQPEDLFELLDSEFERRTSCNISFSVIRRAGEAEVRRKYRGTEVEDVTIDEIYENIGRMFRIDSDILNAMEVFEKKLEVTYAKERKSIKDIYQMVSRAGKKIILITDMYLDRQTIEAILEKNGYDQHVKLFISSEYRKLKGTGSLYECVLRDLKVAPEHILHIGDNTVTDIEVAQSKGLAAYHVPKAIDCFLKPEYKRGKKTCVALTQKLCGTFISYEKLEKSLGYRCMIAQCATKYFDNPYRPYQPESVFNQDSYFVGYYLVGMYLLGLNKWIDNIVTQGGYDTVFFTSRDGWLPMIAYNILREKKKNLPRAEYFYTSRKAVLPAMIKNELDFYDLPIDLKRYTPQKLFQLLDFCTQRTESEWQEVCLKNKIAYGDIFEKNEGMQKVVELFVEEFYDSDVHQKNINTIRAYYSKLNEKSIMFDMGYSGRIQEAISYLAGMGIDVMYVHSDVEKHDLLSRRGDFKIYSYFDFVPQMSDALREYLLSALGPSCIGYKKVGNDCVPIFADYEISREERDMAEGLQRGAKDFVEDFYNNFGDLLDYIPYKSAEVSLPLEAFLRFNVEADREIFSAVKFEDVVYGGEKSINLKSLIEMATEWLPNYLEL